MSTTPWVYTMDMDLSQKFSMDEIEVKLLDVITLDMNIYDEGLALDITNCPIVLQAKLSNNTTYIQTNFGITKSGNRLIIECTDRLTQVGGLTKIEVKFLFSNSTKPITSRWIYMNVAESAISINRDTTQSTLTATEFINNLVNELASLQTDLTDQINLANQAILNLQNEEANADNKISNIQTAITNAENEITKINTAITNASTAKSDLQNVVTQNIADVNNVISSATTAKTNLQLIITTAQQINSDLTTTTTNANASKSDLQTKINEAEQIKIDLQNFDPNSVVQNTNLMLNKMNSNQLLMTFTHTLNCYPFVQLIFVENGFGLGTFGTSPFSANGISDMIRNSVEYTSLNEFKIYVPTDYYINGTQTITKITDYKYMINFSGSTKSIMIQMYKM